MLGGLSATLQAFAEGALRIGVGASVWMFLRCIQNPTAPLKRRTVRRRTSQENRSNDNILQIMVA